MSHRGSQPRHYQPDGRFHGVVVAIWRESDGKLLLVRRSRHVKAPLRVCFPGGGVEKGETLAQAAVREMKEELGVAVELQRQVWRWDSPEHPLTLWGFVGTCCHDQFTADPFEIAELMWLTPEEAITHPDAMPTNREFIEHVLRHCSPQDERRDR